MKFLWSDVMFLRQDTKILLRNSDIWGNLLDLTLQLSKFPKKPCVKMSFFSPINNRGKNSCGSFVNDILTYACSDQLQFETSIIYKEILFLSYHWQKMSFTVHSAYMRIEKFSQNFFTRLVIDRVKPLHGQQLCI